MDSRLVGNYYFSSYMIFYHHILIKKLRYRLQVLMEMGLMDYWIKKYTPRIDQCLLNNRKSTNPRQSSLDLRSLSSAFAVLGIGFAISFLVFLLEQITSLAIRRHRNN